MLACTRNSLQGLVVPDTGDTNLVPYNLTLNIYLPTPPMGMSAAASAVLSPAIVLAHGGGNSGGDNSQ